MINERAGLWASTKGFLIDITGVLYDSGGGAIPGSIEAVRRYFIV